MILITDSIPTSSTSFLLNVWMLFLKFPGGSVVKNPPANAGDSFDPRVRKISGGGNGNTPQCSSLNTGQRSLRGITMS